MGLDMYLTKRKYLGLNYKHNIEEGKETKIIVNDIIHDHSNLVDLGFRAAYWRKANGIHNFFVSEVQDNVDNCASYYVEKSILEKLVNFCKLDIEYLKSFGLGAEEDVDIDKLNIKPSSGFFFGSTEIDSYFYECLKDTIEQIEPLLLEEDFEYYYQSSW